MTGERPDAVDFEKFVAAEQYRLLRVASALTGDAALADDIVAASLERAYALWERVAAVEHPAAYVRRMVVNEFLSHTRRERRMRSVAVIDENLAPLPDHADAHAERESVKAKLAALPRRQRAVLVLRYYEGLSDQEIADVLGCPNGTVRSLISRALGTLRVEQTEDGWHAESAPGRRVLGKGGTIR